MLQVVINELDCSDYLGNNALEDALLLLIMLTVWMLENALVWLNAYEY